MVSIRASEWCSGGWGLHGSAPVLCLHCHIPCPLLLLGLEVPSILSSVPQDRPQESTF